MNPLEPLVLRGRVVSPREVIPDGVVVVEGESIAWVGAAGDAPAKWAAAVGAAPSSQDTLLPGFVDLHN
ncbi:MAG: N-acetylglucosamine-6-phosphate deacetylase, partial [Actinomycetota bacterium]|nr:N-acetylglucosamine-6-phosphate deacetylase [Actinomycetota bacterium]